jgi:nitrous oxide reductase
MQKNNDEPGHIDRRRLLQGAGVAIGAAGATVAGSVEAASVARGESKPQHAGYRESEDVLTYYKFARF